MFLRKQLSFTQAIEELVVQNPDSKIEKPFLQLTPNESVDEFWLPLSAFNFGATCKNGCGGVEILCSNMFKQFPRLVVHFLFLKGNMSWPIFC